MESILSMFLQDYTPFVWSGAVLVCLVREALRNTVVYGLEPIELYSDMWVVFGVVLETWTKAWSTLSYWYAQRANFMLFKTSLMIESSFALQPPGFI